MTTRDKCSAAANNPEPERSFQAESSMEFPARSQILLETADEEASFRFASYNILADGPAYALSDKFSYCPMSERIWEQRFPRLLAELDHYDADLYAIQELQQAPYPTYQRDFLPALQVSEKEQHIVALMARGYEGIAAPRDSNHPALFVRKATFEVVQSTTMAITSEARSFLALINAPGAHPCLSPSRGSPKPTRVIRFAFELTQSKP
eukprot:1184378-Prorocentrum_minimum.AAC.4